MSQDFINPLLFGIYPYICLAIWAAICSTLAY